MFELHSNLNGHIMAMNESYLPTASEAISVGEALVLSSGALTACGATTKPTFIALEAVAAASPATNRVHVLPVTPDQFFRTTFSASPASVVVGDLVTINTGALNVTATESSGVARVEKIELLESGGGVIVSFPDRA